MTSGNENTSAGDSRRKYLKIVSPGNVGKGGVSKPFGQPTEKNFQPVTNPLSQASDVGAGFHTTTTRSLNDVVDEFRRLKITCKGCNQKLDVSTLKPFSQFECPVCGTLLHVPQKFDNYLLESAEGQGGMATVYRGRDLTLDREVAIKVLSPAVARDRERCELFLNEARTAATINHYAVVPIYTCGIFESQPFIVMQYMKNGSMLNKISVGHPSPVLDVVRWMKSVAEGLECAHRHGIIHHDIKPGNIMVDNTGSAKIGDFGIAQAINDTRATRLFEITKSWVSPHYVSPEKAVSGKEDYRGDIYSLGATFYHILTGQTPFKHDDIEELIKLRLVQEPRPPHRLNRQIPRRLSRLIMDMMVVNPLNRPDYEEIISELEFILEKMDRKRQRHSSPSKVSRSLKSKVVMILLALMAWMGIVSYIYRIVSSAGVEGMSELRSTVPPPDEKVIAAGQCFAAGDSERGGELARKILEDNLAAPKDRKCAALLLAIANFLNNNRNAADNCGYIISRLGEAGISPTAPVTAIVRYLQRQDISASDLREKLKDGSMADAFAGNLAILLRDIYWKVNGDGGGRAMIPDLQTLQNYAVRVEESDWTSFWKERVTIYAEVINRGRIEGRKLEPLFIKYMSENSN